MLHYIQGRVEKISESEVMIINDNFGIQAQYAGVLREGAFYTFPYLDDNTKTMYYFAFDTILQKQSFAQLLKISGVGPKTAFGIANMDKNILMTAIDTFDVKVMQSIPGVGPKTAKRLLVELKSTLTTKDVAKLAIDDKLLKSIVTAMKTHGYDANMVKKQLQECPISLDKDHLPEIMKWLITSI